MIEVGKPSTGHRTTLLWLTNAHTLLNAADIQKPRVRVWSKEDSSIEADNGAMHIGILGFGTFGQFLAERLVKGGHRVTATSRSDYAARAKDLGVTFFNDIDDFCEDHPEIVIISTSILSFESVSRK